jgi:thiol-disulfide isomerase/thioredoxin
MFKIKNGVKMAATESKMIELGTKAIDFTLYNPLLKTKQSLSELKSEKATLIMFICNHCPFVKHINKGLVEFANEYISQGVSMIAINSNDVENYPEDSPIKMAETVQMHNYPFPYLYDETQEVAKAYQAACTPDFYIFDKNMELAYRGQMDSSRPSNGIPVTGGDLKNALDALLKGDKPSSDQKPSIGCNIKWKR